MNEDPPERDDPYRPPRGPGQPEDLRHSFVLGFILGTTLTVGLAAMVYLVPAEEENVELMRVSALGLAAILAPVMGVVTGMFVVRWRMRE